MASPALGQSDLMAFNSISTFVLALGKEFGARQKSLALYARLVEKTTFTHTVAILKHVSIFKNFIAENHQAIEENSEAKLNGAKLIYSDRVYIDLKNVFNLADDDVKKVIWSHLLTIYGVICPDSTAKEILKKIASQTPSPESELVNNIIQKMAPHLEGADTSNPMSALMGLMASGALSELVGSVSSSMNNGNLDLGKLVACVQTSMAKEDPTGKLDKK